jgi:aspartyl-tRNA(Asn)/glutamyl-tRNA(Gln) amidotransferase subunit B
MRSKEDAHDYRYFPDPDLLPVMVAEELIARIKAQMPELPEARRKRFVAEYALPEYDAALLTASRAAADYFEAVVKASGVEPKLAANWQLGELAAALNRSELDISANPLHPEVLAGLLKRLADGTISTKAAKKVFDVTFALSSGNAEITGYAPTVSVQTIEEVIEKEGLRQISDAGAIEKLVDEVLAANEKQVADYRAGKQKAFNALVGQVMKATRGSANPAQVNEVLRRRLG